MNKLVFINKVKYNKTIYTLYNCIGSKCISLLKFFFKTDEKLIIFASFGGRRFDDSPRAIYEALLDDNRFDNYRLVWAFIKPHDFILTRGEKVKIDTLAYFVLLLRARVWVTNSSMTRGLSITGKNTFVLNTWHGSAIKKMGSDINEGNESFALKGGKMNKGIMLAQSQYDVDIFSKAFHIPEEGFRIIGLPRNDQLFHHSKAERDKIRKELGIDDNKIAILYAPTFREYDKDTDSNVICAPPVDFNKWKLSLSSDYVLLFRAHYEVTKSLKINNNDFVKDVSTYKRLNELMIASDMLISDYSSIFFDYSILGKPMLCYAYDYERYNKERGLYFDIRNFLLSAEDETALIELIRSTSLSCCDLKTLEFRKKYVTAFGSAANNSLDIIFENI